MKTKFHLSAGVSPTETNCLVRHQPVEQSLFDIPKSRATLLYYEIEMVQRTTFICSSTCRKAEHVEQPKICIVCLFLIFITTI